MRNCTTFFCTNVVGTGVALGAAAAGEAVGASILTSAGWTIGGLTVGSLSSAAVVGTATIVGPLVCCAAVCGAISVEHNKDVGNMLALSAVAGLAAGLICLPVTAVTGAAMTKIAGAGLGYAAASGGIGLGVLGISAVVGTVAIMCVGGSCFALVHAARKITGNRFGFTSEQAIADSRAYNEPTAELSAVPVDVVDGKITAVHYDNQQPVCDKFGKSVTAEEFANLVLSKEMELQMPRALQMS